MIRDIKPLPISEELLGAYLEGNLPQSEMAQIEALMQNDADFSAFVDEVSVVDIPTADTIYNESPDFGIDFELPEIPSITISQHIDINANLDSFTPELSIETIHADEFTEINDTEIEELEQASPELYYSDSEDINNIDE